MDGNYSGRFLVKCKRKRVAKTLKQQEFCETDYIIWKNFFGKISPSTRNLKIRCLSKANGQKRRRNSKKYSASTKFTGSNAMTSATLPLIRPLPRWSCLP